MYFTLYCIVKSCNFNLPDYKLPYLSKHDHHHRYHLHHYHHHHHHNFHHCYHGHYHHYRRLKHNHQTSQFQVFRHWGVTGGGAGRGTLYIFAWGCAAGTIMPTRPCSADFTTLHLTRHRLGKALFFFRVSIPILENKVKKRTTARTDQTTWKGLSIRYFDWPILVFNRFIRATYDFTEYMRCKIIGRSYIWYDVVRCSYLDKKNN